MAKKIAGKSSSGKRSRTQSSSRPSDPRLVGDLKAIFERASWIVHLAGWVRQQIESMPLVLKRPPEGAKLDNRPRLVIEMLRQNLARCCSAFVLGTYTKAFPLRDRSNVEECRASFDHARQRELFDQVQRANTATVLPDRFPDATWGTHVEAVICGFDPVLKLFGEIVVGRLFYAGMQFHPESLTDEQEKLFAERCSLAMLQCRSRLDDLPLRWFADLAVSLRTEEVRTAESPHYRPPRHPVVIQVVGQQTPADSSSLSKPERRIVEALQEAGSRLTTNWSGRPSLKR